MTSIRSSEIPQQPPSKSLGHQAARGAAWSAAYVVSIKIVNILGQIALAWLLVPSDLGVVGLALTVSAFASLLLQTGIREILIQRGRNFSIWEAPAFWLSMFLGLITVVGMLAVAPTFARVYGDRRLIGLIAILSGQSIANAAFVTPEAKLQIDMRFGKMALLSFFSGSFQTIASVILAALRFGPYSIILAAVGAAVARMIAGFYLTGLRIPRRLKIRRWRYMIGTGSLVLFTHLFVTITWQGDYLILGRLVNPAQVGLYYWAFGLSVQALQLLSQSVGNVLLPTLSKLQLDPHRQLKAFVRVARIVLLLSTPACFLQAALAEPVVHLLFDPKWYPAIPIVQLLSLGWSWFSVTLPAYAFMKAQGRYQSLAILTGSGAAVFVICVAIFAYIGGAIGAAVGVSIYAMLMGPITVYASISALGGGVRETFATFWPSFLAATISSLVGATAFAVHFKSSMLQFLTAAFVGSVVYVFAIRWLASDAWDELIRHIPFIPRRRSLPPTQTL